VSRTAGYEGPFRREGLLRRSAPFHVAMLVGYAALRLPADQRDDGEILAAAAVNLVLIALAVFVPWDKLPKSAEVVPPLMYIAVIAMLRDALGGSASSYSTLLILPILWISMYGTRKQLAAGVVGVGLVLTMPLLLIGSPEYTDTEWRRALLWVTVSGIIGLAVQDLVGQVRQRADALHTVSAAVGRRTQETESRPAICEAARENAQAQYVLLLEPDANARRLVTTAATDPRIEATVLYLNQTESPAVKAFLGGREHFEPELGTPPFAVDGEASPEICSGLWYPISSRDATLGVLVLAWTEPIRRLPETLPAVMEALAAEAVAVIERTSLLLKREGAVRLDDVTGLPNERAWEEEVTRELSDARRQEKPVSVVVLELGEFDDGPGSSLGEADKQLLREAADRWRAELAPWDFIAHRGTPGRFAAFLPGTRAEDAEATATRLRSAAPAGHPCHVAVVSWNGIELPAALVGRAESQIELERAAARAD
jgi:GGDEF domain-containing protein